ncbi:MAG: transcriptional regulator NrdR [Candidatus Nanohaloarchaea archaeon]
MKCPYCGECSTNVVDTRESRERVRRRRECSSCERRFTTYETVEKYDIKVIKQDGREEDFREEKIRSGIEKAAEKTQLSEEGIEDAVDEVKKNVVDRKEIEAEEIGEFVKEALKKRDEVAYIRFASVYDSFENAESFQEEVEALQEG